MASSDTSSSASFNPSSRTRVPLPVTTAKSPPASMDYTSGLPLLALSDDQSPLPPDPSTGGFDYAAFLGLPEQDVDYDYLGEETTSTSASSHTLAASHSPEQAAMIIQQPQRTTPPSIGRGADTVHPRQRLERRGHTKSRRGCFNCKRRRIKCQETRPACGHCIKTGLKCEYPTMPQVVHQPQHQIPLFSLQDMRFFQHFLFQCYPSHPIGADSIWTHEVPCLSEKYEFLMHAVLGLAASELTAEDPSDMTLLPAAMAHRVKAIKAIKKALAGAAKADTFEEGNALMATCFALTFQSVLLDDGMVEYMTFVRGIVIIAIQMYMKGAKFMFGNFMNDSPNQALEPLLRQVPVIDTSWTDAAALSLRGLEPLCKHQIENDYHKALVHIVEQLYVSSWGAHQGIAKHYGWWMMLPHDQFQHLIDPGNQVGVLLAAHWIALKQIMATITDVENMVRVKQPDSKKSRDIEMGLLRWLKYLNRIVDIDHLPYNQWPLWVEAQLDRDRGFFGKMSRASLRSQ